MLFYNKNEIVLVDDNNGVFLLNPIFNKQKSAVDSFKFSPILYFKDYSKMKIRDSSLIVDYNKNLYLMIICTIQAHQTLMVFRIDPFIQKNPMSLEIQESKLKARRIYFNPLWNSIFLCDIDDNFFMLEFFPGVYFENYWVNFQFIEENKVYEEKEDEFDLKPDENDSIDLIKLINNLK